MEKPIDKSREKHIPEYKRPTLLEENKTLKETIKAIQDENANLTNNNHEFDKENAILKERLSNFGVRDLLKNAGWFGAGTGVGLATSGQYSQAIVILIISIIVLMAFSVYDNFRLRKRGEKEKVGN